MSTSCLLSRVPGLWDRCLRHWGDWARGCVAEIRAPREEGAPHSFLHWEGGLPVRTSWRGEEACELLRQQLTCEGNYCCAQGELGDFWGLLPKENGGLCSELLRISRWQWQNIKASGGPLSGGLGHACQSGFSVPEAKLCQFLPECPQPPVFNHPVLSFVKFR